MPGSLPPPKLSEVHKSKELKEKAMQAYKNKEEQYKRNHPAKSTNNAARTTARKKYTNVLRGLTSNRTTSNNNNVPNNTPNNTSKHKNTLNHNQMLRNSIQASTTFVSEVKKLQSSGGANNRLGNHNTRRRNRSYIRIK